jgi:hypothetical protein
VGGGRCELVADNLDPNESDVARVDADTLERWRALGADRPEQSAAARPAGAMPEPERAALWPWLLALLVAAAVVESWVGNWHLRVRRGVAT